MRCRGVWVHVGGNGMNLTFFGFTGAFEDSTTYLNHPGNKTALQSL